jgi:spore coat polysaccharide biosynthesis protein SpsF
MTGTIRIGAIIEARMSSSRLPGKVLKIVRNESMLERLINRLRQVSEIDEIIVATTINLEDEIICRVANSAGAQFYRGSEEDVLSRVLEAAQKFNVDVIVEITGDCPIVDIGIVTEVLQNYLVNSYDYVSNSNIRSYPDGMDVQVFSRAALEKSSRIARSKLEREHVTLHIRQNPEFFSIHNLQAPLKFYNPTLGLTLDTEEDLVLLSKIILELEPSNKYFGLAEILTFLDSNPALFDINANVKRKGDT